MMSLAESLIGFLAPPQCIDCGEEGFSLCVSCAFSQIIPYGERCFGCARLSPRSKTCTRCRRVGSPSHVWVTTNYEHIARQLLHVYKFDQQRVASESLARIMVDTFHQYANGEDNYLVVPVPTASKRVRERGFDHSALLANKIAAKLDLECQTLLGRLGQTRQVGSKRPDRIKQLEDRFWVKKPHAVAGRKVLLVDDVVTTGATLNAASYALHQAGAARVDALVFAKRQ